MYNASPFPLSHSQLVKILLEAVTVRKRVFGVSVIERDIRESECSKAADRIFFYLDVDFRNRFLQANACEYPNVVFEEIEDGVEKILETEFADRKFFFVRKSFKYLSWAAEQIAKRHLAKISAIQPKKPSQTEKPKDLLKAALAKADDLPKIGSLWLHVKSETVYRVVGASLNEKDVDLEILYVSKDHPLPYPWSRPIDVFLDGRFLYLNASEAEGK